METKRIKLGKITEQELVDLFGNEAQKKSYEKNGRFVSNYKQSLLKNISKYCEIEDCGKRIYRILEVYKYSLPSNFQKMNKSLYKYIVPLILSYLVDGHDENNKIDMCLNKWAETINMINKNYNIIKNKQNKASEEFQCPLSIINEFFNKSDDMIKWYINNAFIYLQSSGLIIRNEVYHTKKETSDGKARINKDEKVGVNISVNDYLASEEEIKYYSHCINIADTSTGITNNKERYYSKKTKLFNSVLKEELYKEKIKCIYKTYETYCTDIEQCKFVLSHFEKNDIDILISKLNDEFTTMIIENAEKRFKGNANKYKYCNRKDDYRQYFEGLCEMVIDKNTEYLKDRIGKKQFEDSYSLYITSERKED